MCKRTYVRHTHTYAEMCKAVLGKSCRVLGLKGQRKKCSLGEPRAHKRFLLDG